MRLKTRTPEVLDRIIHERARLSILSALAAADELSFPEVQAITGLTDGNLSVQLRTLEVAGHVALRKSEAGGRRARTGARMTQAGRRAFRGYLEALRRVIGKVRP